VGLSLYSQTNEALRLGFRMSQLSTDQIAFLRWISDDRPISEIATLEGRSEAEIRGELRRAVELLGVESIRHAVELAKTIGLI
jgi:DNA-binding CsgD family transcriptional regulator